MVESNDIHTFFDTVTFSSISLHLLFYICVYFWLFNMLNYVSKKISATFLLRALAIFKRVSVVVVVIDPHSNPEITVRDTPLFSASSHCDIFFSFLHSLIL
nr:MAG TPA: hypothetical protein [Caudoviricetes sp.]